MIDCKNKDDCRIMQGPAVTTCAYYPPVYDGHGNNTNPDGNTTTSKSECLTCGRKWVISTQYGKTTHEEIV